MEFEISPGVLTSEYEAALARITAERFIPRLFNREAKVYGKTGSALASIENRLGWLSVAERMCAEVKELEAFAKSCITDGIKQVIILGMGGSSLAPEVFKTIFGPRRGLRGVDILDTTYPDSILALEDRLSLSETLFIVASKSGRTVETLSQAKYFFEVVKKIRSTKAGAQFVAITDEGSDLQKFAEEREFRRVFINPSDIGGRYSALSYFGLVPASFSGVKLAKLLDHALSANRELREESAVKNSAAQLGALWGAGAANGRDKLTFVASKSLAPFVPWVEQLIAESTGKEGVGVTPIEGEPLGAANVYGPDRLFAFLRVEGEETGAQKQLQAALEVADVPHYTITLPDTTSVGYEFMRQEIATATAGYVMDINPFDEPNVQESKDNTSALLAELEKRGEFPQTQVVASWGEWNVIDLGDPAAIDASANETPEKGLKKFFTGLRNDSYVAVLCFFEASPETEAALARLRGVIRERFGVATLRGYGPRYLHSIGQLYKGGAATGHFISLTRNCAVRVPIPDAPFSFNQLIEAQAQGDAQALLSRKLPLMTLNTDADPALGIQYLSEQIDTLFAVTPGDG